MTPRQQFFVLEYLIDLNATGAAIRAGYSPRSAQTQSAMLLRRPEIASAIREAMADRARRIGITRQRVLDEYTRIAFADMRLLADWGPKKIAFKGAAEISEDTAAAIAFIADLTGQRGRRLTFKTFDKRKALECLARILGMNVIELESRALPHA